MNARIRVAITVALALASAVPAGAVQSRAIDAADVSPAALLRAALDPERQDKLRYAALCGAALDATQDNLSPAASDLTARLLINRWAGLLELGITAPVVAELEALPENMAELIWRQTPGLVVLDLDGVEVRIRVPDIRASLVEALILEGRLSTARERFKKLIEAIDERARTPGTPGAQLAYDRELFGVRELLEHFLVRHDEDPFPLFERMVRTAPWGFDLLQQPLSRRLGVQLAERSAYPQIARFLRAEVANDTASALATCGDTFTQGHLPPAALRRWERDLADLRRLEAELVGSPTSTSRSVQRLYHAEPGIVVPTDIDDEGSGSRVCSRAKDWGSRGTGSGWPRGLLLVDLVFGEDCTHFALALGPGAADGETSLWLLVSPDGGRTWPLRARSGLFVAENSEVCSLSDRARIEWANVVFELGLRAVSNEYGQSDRTDTTPLSWIELRREIEALIQDSDADGWSDFFEHHVGISAESSDSDADGFPDPADPFPLLAESEVRSPTGEVLAAALTVAGPDIQDGWLFPPYIDPRLEESLVELDPLPRVFVLEGEELSVTALFAPRWEVVARDPREAPAETSDDLGSPSVRVELLVLDRAQEHALVVAASPSLRRSALVVLEDGRWRVSSTNLQHCRSFGACAGPKTVRMWGWGLD